MRAPFLAIGGNNMYSMMYDANFTYDSSMPIYEERFSHICYLMKIKHFLYDESFNFQVSSAIVTEFPV